MSESSLMSDQRLPAPVGNQGLFFAYLCSSSKVGRVPGPQQEVDLAVHLAPQLEALMLSQCPPLQGALGLEP